jgi:excisionase family DNA binding protein
MLTTGDVAKLFNVSAQTVINWLEQGRLPFERIGNGPRRLTEANVLRYVQEIRISPEALDPTIYQSVLHAVNGGKRPLEGPLVWVLDRNGQVLAGSEASLREVGVSDFSEVQGVAFGRFLQLRDADGHSVAALADQSGVAEYSWQSLEGSQSGRVTVTPWFSVPGEISGWVLAFRGKES